MPLGNRTEPKEKPAPAAQPQPAAEMTDKAETLLEIRNLRAQVEALGAQETGATKMELSERQKQILDSHAANERAELDREKRWAEIEHKPVSAITADDLTFLRDYVRRGLAELEGR